MMRGAILATAAAIGTGYAMDFPAIGVTDTGPDLGAVIAGETVAVATNGMDLLAELPDERAVRELTIDLAALAELPQRGLIVTARADAGQPYDVVSRFFAPRAGVPEDPVTGSAHCCLAPYWGARLGREQLVCFQASERGGTVRTHWRGERVILSGPATIVAEGTLHSTPPPADTD